MSELNLHRASLYRGTETSLPLRNRLRTLGLSKTDAKRLTSYIHTQVKCQGVEGAIQFLKRISECLNRHLMGVDSRTPWVKTYKGFPKALLWLNGKYDKEILFRLTKMGSFITLRDLTPSQVRKFRTAVETPPPSECDLERAHGLIARGLRSIPLSDFDLSWRVEPYPLAIYSELRAEKDAKLTKRQQTIRYNADLILRTGDYLKCPLHWPVAFLPSVKKTFYPMCVDPKGTILHQQDLYTECAQAVKLKGLSRLPGAYAGRIGCTQEPGGKARFFASPLPLWQCALAPLHESLFATLRRLKPDCTHDQAAGALWAQVKLLEGKTVHSVDLSNATDRFPLSLQLKWMKRSRLSSEQVYLFEYVSRLPWEPLDHLKGGLERREIKWAAGQPLGLKPSFGAFALTHHLLVRGMCLELGLNPDDSYRILGDDIVISDDRLHHLYCQVLGECGVEVAVAKSHSSNQYAEFAGYSITHSWFMRAGKFRQLTFENILAYARAYKSDLRYEVTPEESRLLRLVLSMPPSYGGLGLDLEDPSDLISAWENRETDGRIVSGDPVTHRIKSVFYATGLERSIHWCTDHEDRYGSAFKQAELLAESLNFDDYPKVMKQRGFVPAVQWLQQKASAYLEVGGLMAVPVRQALGIMEIPEDDKHAQLKALKVKVTSLFAISASASRANELDRWVNLIEGKKILQKRQSILKGRKKPGVSRQ